MSNTFEQSRTVGRDRLSWHYIGLIVGLALAGAMAMAFSNSPSKGLDAQDPVAGAASPPGTAQFVNEQAASTVVFYLASTSEAAAIATSYEELAQWVRNDSGSLDPKRSVFVLDISSDEARENAVQLMNRVMAAANFLNDAAPRFVVSDLP